MLKPEPRKGNLQSIAKSDPDQIAAHMSPARHVHGQPRKAGRRPRARNKSTKVKIKDLWYWKVKLLAPQVQARLFGWFEIRLGDLKKEYNEIIWKYLRLKTEEEKQAMVQDAKQWDLFQKLKDDVAEARRLWREITPEATGYGLEAHDLPPEAQDFFWKPHENPMVAYLDANWHADPYTNPPRDLRKSDRDV